MSLGHLSLYSSVIMFCFKEFLLSLFFFFLFFPQSGTKDTLKHKSIHSNTDLNFLEVELYFNLDFDRYFGEGGLGGQSQGSKKSRNGHIEDKLLLCPLRKAKEHLFNVFYQCLDTEVECTLRTFANSTKLGRAVNSSEAGSPYRVSDKYKCWAIPSNVKF